MSDSMYLTGNAVPSADPRDRWDNGITLDDFVSGSLEQVKTRTGKSIYTLAYLNRLLSQAKAQIDSAVSGVNTYAASAKTKIDSSVKDVEDYAQEAKQEMQETAAALGDDLNNKHASTYEELVGMPQNRDAVVGVVDADPDESKNGWYYFDLASSAWVRFVNQPVNSAEVRFGLVPFLSYDAKKPAYFNDVSGFVRSVVNGRIQFAPNGSTASVGYFARNLLSSERIDPSVSDRLRYRIRRTAGNLSRLYVAQIRDTAGNYWIYYPYSATPNNLVDDGGWVTYEVDLSRRPDGSAWPANTLLDQIFISLSLGNGNSTWQLDWLAVGAARSDAVYNADLKRQAAMGAVALSAVDASSIKRDTYGFVPKVEAVGGVTSFWTGLSGFTIAAANGYTVFTPNGTTTSVGYANRTLSASEEFDPSVNSCLKYRIKKSGGAAQRAYVLFLRDSAGVGHYYRVDANAKYSLVDRTDWVTYEVNIGSKPDGSPWAGETIKQVWLSLTTGTDGITWTVDWLAVGKPVNNLVANSEILRLAEKVDAIPGQQASSSNALTRLKAALYHPLQSVYIGLIGDSITVGVGAENANNSWASLLHRWLGESFADGVLTTDGNASIYSTDLFVPLENPFIPSDGPIFHIVNNGEKLIPTGRYNTSAYTSYYYPFDKTASGASGNYNQPITFDLTGDNLTVMYCAFNNADPDGSVVELRGNGVVLGSFSYYGPESFSKLAEITFPYGKYKMTLTNKSQTNQFRLEGFRFKKTVTVANDGISGSGTGSWLPGSAPLNNAIARKSEFVTVMLGTNDRVGKSSYIVYFYLARIVKALRDAGKDVILMAANAVTASAEAPNGGRGFGQREVAAVTKLLADELGLAFIDNHQATVMAKVKGETWTADGLHPNDYGYSLMFDNIRAKILG